MHAALALLFTASIAFADEAVISSFAESTAAPHWHIDYLLTVAEPYNTLVVMSR